LDLVRLKGKRDKWLRKVYRLVRDEINEEFRNLSNEKFGRIFMYLVENYIKKIHG
jgi:hypothetical protein